ncbi:fatty acid desaturase [Limnoglobus roseus]|uniref:Acyl-CoA desaturase n=1 Tax=Limnoglobus roseus TaxID=2598579 RepID=A0A5C1ATH6_9BACT|nr:fatty acid desaturase [Limnoglobus roseus]QEL20514.1 acyl-CoA desaturase [Limnoglobus roseus]
MPSACSSSGIRPCPTSLVRLLCLASRSPTALGTRSPPALTLLAFVKGAAASRAIVGYATLRLGRRYAVALLAESALFSAAMVILIAGSKAGHFLVSAACGLQNGLVSTYSGGGGLGGGFLPSPTAVSELLLTAYHGGWITLSSRYPAQAHRSSRLASAEPDCSRENRCDLAHSGRRPAARQQPTWSRASRIGLSLSPLISVHVALVGLFFVPVTLISLVMLFVMTRISGLGITVGFHRYLSHHAFRTSRPLQFLMAAAGCTALQKGPLWWVIHHREHHMHSDTEGDVHSPVVDGFWYGHCGWLFANDLMTPDTKNVRDLLKYPELVWLDRLWMIPGVLAAAACYAIAGGSGLIFGYCLNTVLVFQVTFAVNSIGHLWGRQRFATGEGSRNNWLLGYLAMGEGWHNNHHQAPTSARHGFAWYEFDMSYGVIKLLRCLGLVWGVRQPPAGVPRHSADPSHEDP